MARVEKTIKAIYTKSIIYAELVKVGQSQGAQHNMAMSTLRGITTANVRPRSSSVITLKQLGGGNG